jgi:hypothetical protein
MIRFVVRWFIGSCVRESQRRFVGADGRFNTSCFQAAVKRRCGLMPTSKAAAYLLFSYGCDQLPGGCHWEYPGSVKSSV